MIYYNDFSNRNNDRKSATVDFKNFKKGHWQYYDKNENPLKDHNNAKYMKWVNE